MEVAENVHSSWKCNKPEAVKYVRVRRRESGVQVSGEERKDGCDVRQK